MKGEIAIIGLYILLGVAVFLALLLSVRVGLNIVYRDDLLVYLKILFIKIRLYPKKEKKRKPKRKKEKKQDAEVKISKVGNNAQKKPSLTESIKLITDILSVFLKALSKHLHVKLARVHISVATSDAASTAILYGTVSGAAACLIDTLNEITNLDRLKSSSISVEPDFLSEKTSADINITLYFSVYGALCVLVGTLIKYIKVKFIKKAR